MWLVSRFLVALFSFLFLFTAHAKVVSTLGVENVNAYYFVLSPNSPTQEQSNCRNTCYQTLNPAPNGGQQWIEINDPAGWIDLEYDVCTSVNYDANKKANCQGYVGHVGIRFSPTQTTFSTIQGGSAQLGPYIAGKPFSVTFISTTGPTFPKPSQYSGVLYRGVNLAGAEFDSGFKIPFAIDALYFVQAGMNTFRLPFKWEYLQADLSVPIDFTQGNAKAYADLIKQLTDAGLVVLIDMHNYMRYRNQVIGDSTVTAEQFANAWGSIAAQFKDNPLVVFDLMNEPNTMATETILQNYNAAMKAIRDAGANQLILLEGNQWSGLNAWSQTYYGTPNAAVFLPSKIQDPANHYAINVHLYLNNPQGGGDGSSECVSPQSVLNIENMKSFTDWLAQNKLKAFLSEMGGIASNNCVGSLDTILTTVEATPATNTQGGFIGWTAWAAGHAWGNSNYVLDLTPNTNGTDKSQMKQAFRKHLIPAK